tara:strand:+ start:241 stop:441 length:201 start_codon:yes stop_codon:yes gene_type:complete
MSNEGPIRWYEKELKKDKREIIFNKKQFIREIKKLPVKELLENIKTPKKISKWKKAVDKVKNFFLN